MNGCPDFETLSALLDGEADAAAVRHVERCAECGSTVSRMRGLGEGLRALAGAREAAPPAVTKLPAAAAPRRTRSRSRRVAVGLASLAAAAAALVVSSGSRDPISPAMADEVVSQHLRAFARGRPCERESSDPAEVSAFLGERLGRSVAVPAPAHGTLVGARRCRLFGEHAGAVVYDEGGVSVTLFLPAPASEAAREAAGAVGKCREARDGQTVCVLPGSDGTPRLVVGELPASTLGALLASR